MWKLASRSQSSAKRGSFSSCRVLDDQLPLGLVIRDLTEILFVQSMIFPSQIHGAVAMQIPAEGDELFRLEVHYRRTNKSRQDLQREYGTSFTTAQS